MVKNHGLSSINIGENKIKYKHWCNVPAFWLCFKSHGLLTINIDEKINK